jgi:Tfp pilus assembly PilM family ATPase
MCNVVLDGDGASFYSRSIYFSAEEVYGKAEKPLSDAERAARLEGLGEVLRRSLSYYEKTFGISKFGWVYLLGNHAQQPDLIKLVRDKTALPTDQASLLDRIGCDARTEPGKFDLAVTLALRGREEPS